MASNHMGSIINFYQSIKGLDVSAHLLHSYQVNKKEVNIIRCVNDLEVKRIQNNEFKLRKEINFNDKEVTTCIINGMRFDGLKSWDTGAFNRLIDAIKEYCTHEDITGHNIQTLDDIKMYCKGSKTNTTARRINKDGGMSHEYAKDSYRWGQYDIIDKFLTYQQADELYKNYMADAECTDDVLREVTAKRLEFLKQYYIRLNGCNPNMSYWSSDRLEDFYITSKILPSFLKNDLKIMIKQDDLKNLMYTYMKATDDMVKDVNYNNFADDLHRLINDEWIADEGFMHNMPIGKVDGE